MTEILNAIEDWESIVGTKCGVIVDAMTYRTAEMFFLGAKEAVQQSQGGDKEAIWETISNNIGALQMFVDTLVLRKHLPMIAYEATYPDSWAKADKLLYRCNQKDDVLLAVNLADGAYRPLKEDAIKTLNQKRPKLTKKLRKFILPELSAFDYNWQPYLGDLEGFEASSDEDKRLLTFLFGRVIFNVYAQAAGADQVFQPKLASLHVLSSLRRDEDRDNLQESVFSRLKEIARGGKEDIKDLINVPWMPTFLPYLLSKDPKSPQDLLDKAIELRKEPSIKDYSKWFLQFGEDFDKKREPTDKKMKELESIRRSINRWTDVPNEDATIVKAHIAPVSICSLDIEHKVHLPQIWGWATNLLPKNRYRKLLMEMVGAERRYRELNTHLKTLWSSTFT
ncbi:MAG: hypothetical protein GY797_40615 [Deltaproteobacteria bacterium]|nr:hypothetical protein [Deltaproteobacteria bacterium]